MGRPTLYTRVTGLAGLYGLDNCQQMLSHTVIEPLMKLVGIGKSSTFLSNLFVPRVRIESLALPVAGQRWYLNHLQGDKDSDVIYRWLPQPSYPTSSTQMTTSLSDHDGKVSEEERRAISNRCHRCTRRCAIGSKNNLGEVYACLRLEQ